MTFPQASEDFRRLNPELYAEPDPKPRKYYNVPTEYRGRVYASVKEAERAAELDLLKMAGHLIAWWPQVDIPVQDEPRIVYRADFVVLLPDLTTRIEDTKGFKTKEYKLKRKLFKAKYHCDIVEV